MTMNRAMWDAGLRPWQEYNGRRLVAISETNLPAEQRVWAVVLSSAIYEYFVYLSAAAGVDPRISHHHRSTATNGNKCAPWSDASLHGGRTLEHTRN